MGAAGITCSCSEMSAKGKSGIYIDLNKVPRRENNMNAYEIMLSESQERMLVVIKKGFEKELCSIFSKWELIAEVGHVTSDQKLTVVEDGEIVAAYLVKSLFWVEELHNMICLMMSQLIISKLII